VIDHFSKEAIQQYLARFDSAFEGDDIHTLRAFFNDSYEVDDARGVADWTPGFFEEFEKRRGYDLKEFLPILMERDTGEISGRILCDYRETISELLYDNFTNNWKNWAHGHDAIIRNQAHGSPANILDLYALSDIPETEGTDPLAIKMASSASNVSGKKLTSSESATWLNEHFQSNLADIKINIDNYLLNGVNHIFYHGTAYSPDDEEWPGWLFYAAVHVNDRNPLWHDMPKLNEYIARCQSFLQQRRTYNDVLLYYPIYDKFSSPGREMIEHFDGKKEQFEGTVFQRAANELLTRGYAFDFISDRQIQKLAVEDKAIFSAGNPYKTIIIARSEYIPLPTFDKLMELARSGAKIMFLEGFPEHTSGYEGFQKNEEMFKKAKKQFPFSFSGKAEKQEYEDGEVLTGSELGELLDEAGVKRESLVDNGIRYIRKKAGDKVIYLLNNSSENKFSGWIPLVAGTNDIILYDPMSGKIGKGAIKTTSSDTQVYLEMSPQQTLILECYDKKVNFEPFEFYQPKDTIALNGSWRLTFQDGGLDEPLFVAMDTLKSWTDLPIHKLKAFSGTATYKYEFENPDLNADQLMLDLGTVKESAAVKLNGKEIGTLIGTVFEIEFSSDLLVEGENVLEIEVTNLMANRIADLDKRNIFWKKFYNVNFPAKLREDRGPGGLFTAKNWDPKASGILGPVRLVVLAKRKIE